VIFITELPFKLYHFVRLGDAADSLAPAFSLLFTNQMDQLVKVFVDQSL
jgi:hypothetical protein